MAAQDAVARLVQGGALTGNPIREAVAAVSVGIVQGQALLDLEYEEDSCCSTDMNVVMAVDVAGQARFIEVQGTAEEAPYTRAQLDAMLQLAEQGILELTNLQQAALAAGGGAVA